MPGTASYSTLFDTYRRTAELRGLEFSLSREEHKNIIGRNCYYCNTPPPAFNCYVKADHTIRRNGKLTRQSTVDLAWIRANGIDRFDNSRGYTINNSVPCCADCNRAKWEMTALDYISHCQKVIAYQSVNYKEGQIK